MEEIEAKFLNIETETLKEKIINLGGQFVGRYDYKRKAYDFPGLPLAQKHAWIRLRDEGDKTVLTYKQRFGVGENGDRDGGMKEIEVVVSDFNIADQFLKEIGLIEKFYEENIRERYILDSVELDIDTWPMIPPYIELEGESWASVEAVALKLGFVWEEHLRCSTMQIYAMNSINENDYKVITFTEQIKK